MNHMRTLTLLGMAIAGCGLAAQESTGTVLGIVRDSSGKPVAGVTVTAAGQNVLGTRTMATDAKGEFRLPLLLPGSYILKAYGDKYVGQQATFGLAAGQILRQEFVLRPRMETASAVVEVVAESAALDKTETQTASSYKLDLLEALPLSNRNAWGAAALAPGVVGTSAPVIRGGMLGSAQATVNGVYVRDPATTMLSQSDVLVDDLVEDVAVVQSPLSAKYGNTSAGLVALTTKTGSNDFHGTLRAKLSRSTWAAVSPSNPNRFDSVQPNSGPLSAYAIAPANLNYSSDDLAKTYEVSISGPIIKDRITFIYGSRITPDSSTTSSYNNLLNSANNQNWKTYLPGVPGVTNGPAAAYAWGISPTAPTVTPTAASTSHTEFNQYEVYFQLAQDHQLKMGYSLQTSKTNGLNTGTIDTSINSGGADNRHQFKSLNYRGLILDGKGIVELKWGRRETRDQNLAYGPEDPIYLRTYTSTATNLLNTGYTQSSSYVTHGFAGVNLPSRTSSETTSLDFLYYLGAHQINAGMEMLRDTELYPFGAGPNNRVFYSMGRAADGTYVTYNYQGSLPSTDLAAGPAPVNPNTGKAVTQAELNTWLNSATHIPQMVVTSSSPGDPSTHENTYSWYLNDLVELGGHLTFMAGVRMDRWRVTDRSGVRISSNALSPRAELKWDPEGNSRHLFSFSVADLRGTFTNYQLSSYLRKGGNISRRFFWDQGSSTPYTVAQSAVTDPSNYGYYYYYSNTDKLKDIDSTIRPDRTRQFEAKYQRSFESGGTFRISAIYRKSYDMLSAWGYDQGVIMADPEGSPVKTSAGAYSRLSRDPYGKRDFKSVETEWSNPVYRSADFNVTWAGNYTFNRGLATNNYSEGNASPVYYSVLAQQNIPVGLVNPYGERQNNQRHNLRTWVTVDIGSPKDIHHTFSLIATYGTGQAITTSQYYYYPAGSFPNLQATAASGYTVSYPTQFTIYPQGRGNRRDVDTYNFNLKWNAVIPIKGTLSMFLEATVNNLFNIIKPVYDVGNSSTTWSSPNQIPTWNPAGGNSTSVVFSPSAATLYTYGSPWYWTNSPRSFTVDLGLRF